MSTKLESVFPKAMDASPVRSPRDGARHEVPPDTFGKRLVRFAWARAGVFFATGSFFLLVFSQTRDIGFSSYSVRMTLGIVLCAWVSAAVQAWAGVRRFHMYAIALTLLVADQALFAAFAYLTGGVASAATSLLGVSCLVGGFLLGVPGAVVAAFAGGVFFSLILLIVQGAPDLLPPDQPRHLFDLSGSQATYYYVFTVLTLVLVGLLASVLAERLQRAGGALEEAHERVERAEKMAALGRLAAGLAHEVRNPLSSISGAVQMLRDGIEREEDRDLCNIVLRESARLNELVSDMVDLSGHRPPQRSLVDLGALVRDVVELAARSGRGRADVAIRREGLDSVSVDADSGQIRQVVWNLVRNAIQASASGQCVTVKLENRDTVKLSVEDQGLGISKESADQLFDAFYTTRSHGTGLGLAVVKRIVDEHGFSIDVQSGTERGACFVVDFGPQARLRPG